jgi:hypothetical protein
MASSSNSTPDMSRVMNELARSINQLNSKLDGLGGSSRPGTSGGGGRAKPANGVSATGKDLKTLKDTIGDTDKVLSKFKKGVEDVEHSLDHLYDTQNAYIKGIVGHSSLSEKSQSKLNEKLNDSIKAHSFLGQSMENAGKKINFFEEQLEETGKFLAAYGDILKEANATSLSAIDDQQELAKALNKLNKQYELSDDVQEMIHKKEYKRAAYTIDQEEKNAVKIRESIKKTSNTFVNLNAATTGLKTGVSKATDALGIGFVKTAMEVGGAVGLITAGVKQVYSQFWSTASAGFGGAFIQLSTTAIGLGISLESLTKITKENMNLVGVMGLKGFTDSLKETELQMMQLGLTTEESAKTRALMNQNAFLAGVDVKDKNALSNATQSQIASFETLRATTGESIETIAAQTKALLTDNDATKIMGTLSKQQRVQMMQGMNLERARLTQAGLSMEAANGVIKSMQQIAGMKTTDRLDNANKLQAAGAMAGMDPEETAKIASIMSKTAANQTEAEKKQAADYFAKLDKAKDSMNGQGTDISSNMLADHIGELTTAYSGVSDNMRQANLGRGLSDKEVQNNKDNATVPAIIAKSSEKIETWLQLIESPLGKIAAGVLGILAIMGKKALTKRKSLIPTAAAPAEETAGINKLSESINKSTGGSSMSGGARPGSSVQENSRVGSQVEHMARNQGWKGPEDKGISGLANKEKEILARKAPTVQATAGSIGSDSLQSKLAANKLRLANQFVGPAPEFIPPPEPVVPKKGIISRVTGKVGGAAKGLIGKAGGLLGKIGGLGVKAIPFLGWAIAGIEGIQGAFDGFNQAADIFGKTANADSLTTSEKVSATIAGALHTLSFGLLPTDSVATFLNDIGTNGVSGVIDMFKNGMETYYTKIIPAIYGGLKSVVGFIYDSITGSIESLFDGKAWASLFSGGGGNGGMIQTILSGLWSGLQFMGISLVKGAITLVDDMVGGMIAHIPFVGKQAAAEYAKMKKDTGIDNVVGFAHSDTEMNRTPEEQKVHDKRKADAKALDDKKNGKEKGKDKVAGSATDANADVLGVASDFGQALSASQLKDQGIVANPSAATTPGVTGPNAANAKDADGNSTTVNNTTNNTSAPPKTAAETLLSGILEKMTSLVDMTDKGLKLAEQDYQLSSTLSRMAKPTSNDSGFAPSIASFMQLPI